MKSHVGKSLAKKPRKSRRKKIVQKLSADRKRLDLPHRCIIPDRKNAAEKEQQSSSIVGIPSGKLEKTTQKIPTKKRANVGCASRKDGELLLSKYLVLQSTMQ